MTKTMVVFKEAPFFYAAFAAIQYHHKLPSSGSRILATLPLAVLVFCLDRCHFARVPVNEASVADIYRRPAPAFHVMAALPAPPAPVPDEAVEEPAGAVEAAPPPVVEPEVFFCFSFCFGQRARASHSFFFCHAFTYFSVTYFSILPNVVLRFACCLPRVYSGVIFPYASVFCRFVSEVFPPYGAGD